MFTLLCSALHFALCPNGNAFFRGVNDNMQTFPSVSFHRGLTQVLEDNFIVNTCVAVDVAVAALGFALRVVPQWQCPF